MKNLISCNLKKAAAICIASSILAYSATPAYAELGVSSSSSSASSSKISVEPEPIAISSGSAFSSGFASVGVDGGNMETLIQKALNAGYGQRVEQSVYNGEVEFIVDAIAVDNSKIYASLRFKTTSDYDNKQIHPRIEVNFEPSDMLEENELPTPSRMSNLGYAYTPMPLFSKPLFWLPTLSAQNDFMPRATASYSMGYSMNGEPNEEGYYEIQLDSDFRTEVPTHAYFLLKEVEQSQITEYTYTIAEWMENPVEGVNTTIDLQPNEMVLKAESDSNINFFIIGDDNTYENYFMMSDGEMRVYPDSSNSSRGMDEDFETYTANWALDNLSFETPMTLVLNKRLEPLVCNLEIAVPIEHDKIIQPLYSDELNQTFSSIKGDVNVTYVEITPLHISVHYNTFNGNSDDMYYSQHEMLQVIVDDNKLFASSGSSSRSSGRAVVNHEMRFSSSPNAKNISISLLQSDGTYEEIFSYNR